MSKSRVGILGVGLVGLALAERLSAARFDVRGFDIDSARREALRAAGGQVAASANDLIVGCDHVLLALYDVGQAEKVLDAAAHLQLAGKVFVQCGTDAPDRVVAFAARLAARGADLVDAPLSGSSEEIRAGDGVMMIGGNPDTCAALAPVFDAIASRRFHLGPVGSGSRAKLATNLLLGLNRAALAEALVFAETIGLDLPSFLDLVRATPAYSRAVDTTGERMLAGKYSPPQSRLRQHRKDVALMQDAAARAHRALPLTTVHAALLDAAIAAGDGDLDNAAVIEAIRRAPPVPSL